MTVPALRPRSPSEIVDAAFQILRAHYGQFVTCTAIAYVPSLLVRLLVIGDPARFLSGDQPMFGGDAIWFTVLGAFVGWLTLALMNAVLMVCASQAYLGEEVDVGGAVRRALPRVPLIMVAAVLEIIFLGLGFMLMIFPVLYVGALLFAVTPVIVLERQGVWAALRRSSSLSKGRKWHILSTLGLALIIYYVLAIGFSAVGALFGNFIAVTLLGTIVTVLVYPVVAITQTLLYYDARILSEGLDIELMTGALGPLSTSGPAAS
jgi:hypothetical protein